MIPIIVKDFIDNLRTWLALMVFATATALIAALKTPKAANAEIVSGFLQGLVIASSMIFAQTVVLSERTKRHIILLKMLPITNQQIVGAKFIAVLLLVLPLANVSCFVDLVTGLALGISPKTLWTVRSVFLLNVLVILYSSIVILFALSFRNQVVVFVPFYLATMLVLFTDSEFVTATAHQISSVISGAWLPLVGALASVVLYWLAVLVFSRKELDL